MAAKVFEKSAEETAFRVVLKEVYESGKNSVAVLWTDAALSARFQETLYAFLLKDVLGSAAAGVKLRALCAFCGGEAETAQTEYTHETFIGLMSPITKGENKGTVRLDLFFKKGEAQTDEGMAYYAQNKDTVNALAIPNTEGGVTVFITSYAAVNRNSQKADEVFRFFELLFSDEAQIDTETVNDARGTLLMLGNLNSFLTHKNAYLQPELLESVQSRVNAVRFYSVMDYTIYDTATTLTWEENPDCAAAAHSVIEALQTRLSE